MTYCDFYWSSLKQIYINYIFNLSWLSIEKSKCFVNATILKSYLFSIEKILAIYILFYELVFESKSFVFDTLSKIDLGKYSMNTPQHGRNYVIAFTKHPGFRFGKPDYLK